MFHQRRASHHPPAEVSHFLLPKGSRDALSAATAALRARTPPPERTERHVHDMNGSTVRRRASSGSMSSRTLRSSSPGHPRDTRPPPVPPLPIPPVPEFKHLHAGSNDTLMRGGERAAYPSPPVSVDQGWTGERPRSAIGLTPATANTGAVRMPKVDEKREDGWRTDGRQSRVHEAEDGQRNEKSVSPRSDERIPQPPNFSRPMSPEIRNPGRHTSPIVAGAITSPHHPAQVARAASKSLRTKETQHGVALGDSHPETEPEPTTRHTMQSSGDAHLAAVGQAAAAAAAALGGTRSAPPRIFSHPPPTAPPPSASVPPTHNTSPFARPNVITKPRPASRGVLRDESPMKSAIRDPNRPATGRSRVSFDEGMTTIYTGFGQNWCSSSEDEKEEEEGGAPLKSDEPQARRFKINFPKLKKKSESVEGEPRKRDNLVTRLRKSGDRPPTPHKQESAFKPPAKPKSKDGQDDESKKSKRGENAASDRPTNGLDYDKSPESEDIPVVLPDVMGDRDVGKKAEPPRLDGVPVEEHPADPKPPADRLADSDDKNAGSKPSDPPPPPFEIEIRRVPALLPHSKENSESSEPPVPEKKSEHPHSMAEDTEPTPPSRWPSSQQPEGTEREDFVPPKQEHERPTTAVSITESLKRKEERRSGSVLSLLRSRKNSYSERSSPAGDSQPFASPSREGPKKAVEGRPASITESANEKDDRSFFGIRIRSRQNSYSERTTPGVDSQPWAPPPPNDGSKKAVEERPASVAESANSKDDHSFFGMRSPSVIPRPRSRKNSHTEKSATVESGPFSPPPRSEDAPRKDDDGQSASAAESAKDYEDSMFGIKSSSVIARLRRRIADSQTKQAAPLDDPARPVSQPPDLHQVDAGRPPPIAEPAKKEGFFTSRFRKLSQNDEKPPPLSKSAVSFGSKDERRPTTAVPTAQPLFGHGHAEEIKRPATAKPTMAGVALPKEELLRFANTEIPASSGRRSDAQELSSSPSAQPAVLTVSQPSEVELHPSGAASRPAQHDATQDSKRSSTRAPSNAISPEEAELRSAALVTQRAIERIDSESGRPPFPKPVLPASPPKVSRQSLFDLPSGVALPPAASDDSQEPKQPTSPEPSSPVPKVLDGKALGKPELSSKPEAVAVQPVEEVYVSRQLKSAIPVSPRSAEHRGDKVDIADSTAAIPATPVPSSAKNEAPAMAPAQLEPSPIAPQTSKELYSRLESVTFIPVAPRPLEPDSAETVHTRPTTERPITPVNRVVDSSTLVKTSPSKRSSLPVASPKREIVIQSEPPTSPARSRLVKRQNVEPESSRPKTPRPTTPVPHSLDNEPQADSSPGSKLPLAQSPKADRQRHSKISLPKTLRPVQHAEAGATHPSRTSDQQRESRIVLPTSLRKQEATQLEYKRPSTPKSALPASLPVNEARPVNGADHHPLSATTAPATPRGDKRDSQQAGMPVEVSPPDSGTTESAGTSVPVAKTRPVRSRPDYGPSPGTITASAIARRSRQDPQQRLTPVDVAPPYYTEAGTAETPASVLKAAVRARVAQADHGYTPGPLARHPRQSIASKPAREDKISRLIKLAGPVVPPQPTEDEPHYSATSAAPESQPIRHDDAPSHYPAQSRMSHPSGPSSGNEVYERRGPNRSSLPAPAPPRESQHRRVRSGGVSFAQPLPENDQPGYRRSVHRPPIPTGYQGSDIADPPQRTAPIPPALSDEARQRRYSNIVVPVTPPVPAYHQSPYDPPSRTSIPGSYPRDDERKRSSNISSVSAPWDPPKAEDSTPSRRQRVSSGPPISFDTNKMSREASQRRSAASSRLSEYEKEQADKRSSIHSVDSQMPPTNMERRRSSGRSSSSSRVQDIPPGHNAPATSSAAPPPNLDTHLSAPQHKSSNMPSPDRSPVGSHHSSYRSLPSDSRDDRPRRSGSKSEAMRPKLMSNASTHSRRSSDSADVFVDAPERPEDVPAILAAASHHPLEEASGDARPLRVEKRAESDYTTPARPPVRTQSQYGSAETTVQLTPSRGSGRPETSRLPSYSTAPPVEPVSPPSQANRTSSYGTENRARITGIKPPSSQRSPSSGFGGLFSSKHAPAPRQKGQKFPSNTAPAPKTNGHSGYSTSAGKPATISRHVGFVELEPAEPANPVRPRELSPTHDSQGPRVNLRRSLRDSSTGRSPAGISPVHATEPPKVPHMRSTMRDSMPAPEPTRRSIFGFSRSSTSKSVKHEASPAREVRRPAPENRGFAKEMPKPRRRFSDDDDDELPVPPRFKSRFDSPDYDESAGVERGYRCEPSGLDASVWADKYPPAPAPIQRKEIPRPARKASPPPAREEYAPRKASGREQREVRKEERAYDDVKRNDETRTRDSRRVSDNPPGYDDKRKEQVRRESRTRRPHDEREVYADDKGERRKDGPSAAYGDAPKEEPKPRTDPPAVQREQTTRRKVVKEARDAVRVTEKERPAKAKEDKGGKKGFSFKRALGLKK
ncbi:hypothetical protein EJ06DRAFT_583807 [Trichodelitschia bisporula]|uniref:Uncharacterized protein n=1 Tax=Trichodelitschia bisporula TaxID=703511 RepID=A0A6G1HPN2_9PEZI|nr:hypothetical protein EJ06DRAFT_583807 [Trichodelitschia bisporula]